MKIEWIHTEERFVPRVGLMTTGSTRDVSKEIGEALIKQGLARKPETGNRESKSVNRKAESGNREPNSE